MLKLLLIIIISIIIAAILISVLKKALKAALFISLAIIIFLIIASFVFPDNSYYQKGKDFILGKSKSALEEGKDKITSYVIIEGNETISKAKEKIFKGIE